MRDGISLGKFLPKYCSYEDWQIYIEVLQYMALGILIAYLYVISITQNLSILAMNAKHNVIMC